MKKLLILTSFLLCFVIAFSQPVVTRTTGANTVVDQRWGAGLNAYLPRYIDTTAANLQIGIDSSGAIAYMYSTKSLWFRQNSPKKWIEVTASGSTTPTWQQTLTQGSVLTTSNIVNFGSNTFVMRGTSVTNAFGVSGIRASLGDINGSVNPTFFDADFANQLLTISNASTNGTFFKIAGYSSASVNQVLTLINPTTGQVGWATGTGGTANSNIGTGLNLLKPAGQEIKRLGFGYGMIGDSTTTANTNTIFVDTLVLFPAIRATIPAGIGTVTTFSAGNLSPLFTSNVATATTTPALTFTLTNAAANTYLGNATGGATSPSYTSAGALTKTDDTNVTLTLGGNAATSLLRATSLTLGWTGTLADARIASASTWNAKQNTITTSGNYIRISSSVLSSNVTPVALTGSPSYTLIPANGVNASLTLSANSTLAVTSPIAGETYLVMVTQNGTGGWTFTGPGSVSLAVNPTASSTTILTDFYDGTNHNWSSSYSTTSVTPAALTKTDDTNVTLTLGGTPTTALLQATSLTVGWTGTLADARIASASTWNAKVGSIGTMTGTNANGLNISGGVLNATFADATNGGMVSNTTQTFNGLKTLGAGAVVQGPLSMNATPTSGNLYVPTTTTGTPLTQAAYLIGGAATTSMRGAIGGGSTSYTIGVNNSYAGFIIPTQIITEGASGAIPIAAALSVKPLNVTAGVSTMSNAATVYIENASNATAGGNYALWIDDGMSRFDGDFYITSGNVGIGTTPTAGYGFQLAGTQANIGMNIGTGGSSAAVFQSFGGLSPAAGSPGYANILTANITEAASGTHNILAGTYLQTPIVTSGVATVTNTANLYILGAMTATVTGNNYSMWVDDGDVRLDGGFITTAVQSSAGTLSLTTATFYSFTGTTTTWSLPTMAANTSGRTFIIKNRGSGAITLDVVGGGATIYDTGAVTSITIAAGVSRTVVSDGNFWNVI